MNRGIGAVLLVVVMVQIQGCNVPFTGPSVPAGKGVVTGGIDWCSGIGSPGPRYMAGRVNVYKGWANTRSSRAYGAWRSTAHPIMHTYLGTNQTYRLALHPGRYTLMSIEGRAKNTSIRIITIRQGAVLHADIEPGCL